MIRQLRLQNGMSQVELARRMNVSKQCVSNWENDNVLPSIAMLTRLADLFQVSTDQLLGRESSNTIDASGLTDEQAAHIRAIVRELKKENHSK
ncbi:MAG: helix-turn-helix transcriptional regulator [Clostridia bacterium]|nr:helix-turn-helix transcriptional regulator [Clostridia bacterium]